MPKLEPGVPLELHCPGCGRYLGTVAPTYFRSAPCPNCGLQTTIQLPARNGRPAGAPVAELPPLEVK